ncbi:MAG: hypothetical protein U5L46_07465 [Agrobacterium sp.]|nr:hypothetical protein [Agrobacterium sp.]
MSSSARRSSTRHSSACGEPEDRCVHSLWGQCGGAVDRPAPQGDQVLTVGEVGLRKGSPYVVEPPD